MPFPGSPNSSSLLSKCGSTLFCFLRNLPLWLIVIVIFVAGALSSRAVGLLDRRSGQPTATRKPLSPSRRIDKNEKTD